MCHDCQEEYTDPTDRRFHAQPIACPVCGPHIWLEFNTKLYPTEDDRNVGPDLAVPVAINLLMDGLIIAIKGLGGFHLACDAQDPSAVSKLRHRKKRIDKPFAVMMGDIDTVHKHCFLNKHERQLLESPERPIVLLEKRSDSSIAREVAPGQNKLGVMLPYTPLHYLLFFFPTITNNPNSIEAIEITNERPTTLVMTSGNLSEEPIVKENEEAVKRLSNIADAFLMHNRPIFQRCDDSVISSFYSNKESKSIYPVRRSRGYAPFPIYLHSEVPPILAVGAELKNTFCLTKNKYAFLSHHIGDLENYETLVSFEKGIRHYQHIFRTQPEFLACDMHPDYLSTRYALERGKNENLPVIAVQHHHAHIVSVMAEHRIPDKETVIGIAFDGTGFGTDGAIWGGEFLLSTYTGFKRVAHIEYVPLPGGDIAIRKPARIALAYLWKANLDWDILLPSVKSLCVEERQAIRSQLESGINAPQTSSLGRLFDAVASLAGIRQAINYEAQAAIELEACLDIHENNHYKFSFETKPDNSIAIDPTPVIEEIVDDVLSGIPPSLISARFHNGLVLMVLSISKMISSQYDCSTVALSGGVWQNISLLSKTIPVLEENHFKVLIHRNVPPNDGGIALGQALVAAKTLEQRSF